MRDTSRPPFLLRLLASVAAVVALPAWPIYRAQARADRILAEREELDLV